MRVSVPADTVQGITVGQLRGAQCLELLWCCMQFELGGDDLFHRSSLAGFTHLVKYGIVREVLSRTTVSRGNMES